MDFDKAVDFTDIGYLETGNELQVKVFNVLRDSGIMKLLSDYGPVVVGTIPIGIDIPGSDVDILCRAQPEGSGVGTFDGLGELLRRQWAGNEGFRLEVGVQGEREVLVCSFFIEGVEIEVFAQDVPVLEQNGYKHMVAEYELLKRGGKALRDRVVELKLQGLKTEPAFAVALGLEGDPYELILKKGNEFDIY